MKNHYLLAQIAHTIRQLMENGIELYKKYNKKLKDISRKLFELFRTRILTETEIQEALKKCQIRFYRENTSWIYKTLKSKKRLFISLGTFCTFFNENFNKKIKFEKC